MPNAKKPSTTAETIKLVSAKEASVRMDVTPDHTQREHELYAALAETRADLAASRVVQESPEAHLARLGPFPTI